MEPFGKDQLDAFELERVGIDIKKIGTKRSSFFGL